MKKFGPIIAILAGLLALVFAILGLLASENVIKDSGFLGEYTKQSQNTAADANTSTSVIYGVLIGIAAIEIALGLWAFANPRGLSAMLLFVIFTTVLVLNIVAATKADKWPASTIIIVVVQALASLGLLTGLLTSRKA